MKQDFYDLMKVKAAVLENADKLMLKSFKNINLNLPRYYIDKKVEEIWKDSKMY